MFYNNNHPNPPAIELVTIPIRNIQRKRYQFLVQTKYLSERQIYAEAYLRGIVSGQVDELVTREQRNMIDNQLRCDFEKWCQTGQDLTLLLMNHRASVAETANIIDEVFAEIARLEASGATLMAIGAQLDFGINCLRRTMIEENEVNLVRRMIHYINQKYCQVCNLGRIFQNRTHTANNNSSPSDFEVTYRDSNNTTPTSYIFSNVSAQPRQRPPQQAHRSNQRNNDQFATYNITNDFDIPSNQYSTPITTHEMEREREPSQ